MGGPWKFLFIKMTVFVLREERRSDRIPAPGRRGEDSSDPFDHWLPAWQAGRKGRAATRAAEGDADTAERHDDDEKGEASMTTPRMSAEISARRRKKKKPASINDRVSRSTGCEKIGTHLTRHQALSTNTGWISRVVVVNNNGPNRVGLVPLTVVLKTNNILHVLYYRYVERVSKVLAEPATSRFLLSRA